MAEIPTYTASLSSARGQRGQVQAELGASGVLPATALGNVGEAIQRAGLTASEISQIRDQKQKEQELRWVGDSSDQLSRVLIQWQQDNAHREDVGDAYRKFADDQVREYLNAAPNSRAADVFKRHVLPSINSDWEQNLKRGEQTRINSFKAAEISGTEADNKAFRFRMANGESSAAQDVFAHDLDMRLQRIDAAYGKIAPLAAAAMKETASTDAVLGALEVDPKFAKEILDSSNHIDAQTRTVLLHKIEEAGSQIDEVAAQRMLTSLNSQLKNASESGAMIPIPPKSTFSVFKKHADLQYDRFVQDASVHNQTVGQWDKIKSYAPEYQAQAIAELKNSTNPDRGEIAFGLHRKLEQAHQDIARGNVAGHIASNYDDVAALFKSATEATSPADRRARLEQAYAKTVFYSGPAPRDENGSLILSEQESKRFLGLSTGQAHVMSIDAANRRGAELNGMGPQDLMLATSAKSMAQEFGNESLAAIAFNDLATLPSEGNRLPASVQLAAAMPSPELAIKFLGVVRGAKDIKPMPDDSMKAFREYLYGSTDGKWNAFRRTFNGDNNQRVHLLDEFEGAILKYAYSLNGEGLNPKLAVQKAVNDTINGSFGFASINGSPTMVLRSRGDGKAIRSDEEIDAIGTGLARSLRDFPLQKLDITDAAKRTIWPQVDAIADPINKLQYVRDAITSRGFFITEAHGQSATVYVMDESGKGTIQQLRDKSGRPFEIVFDDLPKQPGVIPRNILMGHGFMAPALINPRQPEIQKTYDIKGETIEPFSIEGWRRAEENDPMGGFMYPFPWYRSKPTTNWPTGGPQFKFQK